ncbi:MAG TPA: DUF4124 domain-containing protein [Ramlibacter sp.]|nr:DUF4124 domain-containing protein [Ramlibacter sp.]
MARSLRVPLLACLLAGALAAGSAEAGIYTCVDGKGRRLTSDRPIAECLDREQKELNASGTVRRVVPPSLTATERTAWEERERQANDARMRQEEERRIQRALLARYPNQAVHDVERGKALQAADDVIVPAERRLAELREERKALDAEAAFFKSPAQWPPKLKRQFEDHEHQVALQQRLVATQSEEKKRIHARFDEELGRLRALWPRPQPATVAAPAAAAAAATVPRPQ